MKKLFTTLFLLTVFINTQAQVSVSNLVPYNTPAYLVNNVLLGGGVTATNITYSGQAAQAGFFYGGLTGVPALGLDSGIVLSSGDVNDIPPGGNQPSTGQYAGPGDPDLLTIAQSVTTNPQASSITLTQDAAFLEFDFTPIGDTVRFNFVFASEEYTTYINTVYNDIFAFLISGPGITGPYASPPLFPNGAINIAHVPSTTTPITISSIHPGLNAQYYISNTSEQSHEFNGFTTKISIAYPVICNQTYHFKIAVADCSDDWLDTGVFIEAGSFTSDEIVKVDVKTVTGDSTIIEGCAGAVLNFTRPDTSGAYTVHYSIGGNAINGTDYNFIPDSVLFPPGIDTVSLTITPILDGLNEGQDTIIITVFTINACGDTNISIGVIYILDLPDMHTFAPDTALPCPLPLLSINAWATGAAPPFTYYWTDINGNPIGNTQSVNVPGLQTDTFLVNITDSCNLITIQDTVIVTLNIPPLTLSVNNDTIICPGDSVVLFAAGGGGNPGYTYQWFPGPISSDSITVFPVGLGVYYVSMIDQCNTITMFDTVYIDASYTPMTVTVPPVQSVCSGAPLAINAIVNDGRSPYTYTWTEGINTFFGNPLDFPTDNPMVSTVNLIVTDYCGNQEVGAVDIEIIACEIIIPNVITPNGDGVNDLLVFENLEHFPNNHLVILNRWGQQLYEKTGYQNDWDGSDYPDGTYFFILELNNKTETLHKGTFSLLK